MGARPPVVLMTATCGPAMQGPMLENLGLGTIRTIRSRTDRPEIMYSIWPGEPLGEGRLPAVIAEWHRTELSRHLSGSKSQVIIYVTTKAIGMRVAAELKLDFFESGTAADEKKRLYMGFRSGQIQAMVATQAFGAGIDIDSVDVVIHAGSPRSMVDFAQESGRAGRAGQTALSIVFRTAGGGRWAEADDNCGGKEMREWLEGSGCRRTGLGRYLDGASTQCASVPGARLCDNCRATDKAGTSVVDEIQRQINSRKAQLLETSVISHAPGQPSQRTNTTL